MKKSTLHQILFIAAFFAVVASVSSCNKGYGCPNNFKIAKSLVK